MSENKKEYACKYETWKCRNEDYDKDQWCELKCEWCDRHRCKDYEQGEEILSVGF